jgi:predicted component of type VI protein secretion system
MSIWLVMQTTDGKERPFALRKDRTVIGRENGCDVRIPVPAVAQKQCQICLQDGKLRLENLAADRDVLHNGSRVDQPTDLVDADRVTIGPVTFVVRMNDELLPDGAATHEVTIVRDESMPESFEG